MPNPVVLDTHVLVYDALEPKRLTGRARRALQGGAGALAVSDITLWELAMLIARGRIDPAAEAVQFIEDLLAVRSVSVLPITPKIAVLAQGEAFAHGDPADRLIAATAIAHGAQLVTGDANLKRVRGLRVLW